MSHDRQVNRLTRLARRVQGSLNDLVAYQQHLENGFSVFLSRLFKRSIPPLKFRRGQTWYHGKDDQPLDLFREIYVDRFYERMSVPSGAVALDIGANIGAMSLFWAEDNPDLRCHAFEPNPTCYATLRQNIEANNLSSQVSTHPEAIGGASGTMDLWTNVPSTLSTAYGDAPREGAKRTTVPMVTLDEVWNRLHRPHIWMLKIDVEGAEADILEAASDEVLANVSNACIEWHDNIVPGAFERCRSRLTEAGFDLRIHHHPWDEGIILAQRPAEG